MEREVPVCWICGSALLVRSTRNRKGKPAITLWCPQDGRHLRAFCNDMPVVEEMLKRIDEYSTTLDNTHIGTDTGR